jgi:putative hydrolase
MADLPPDRPDDGADGADGPDDHASHEPDKPNPFAGTPFEQIFGGMAGGDMSGLQAMFGQLQRMFAPHEGSVNWDFSRDLARQVVAQRPDRSPDAGDVSRLKDAAQLAEHWLDSVTDLPSANSTVAAWSRAEWVEASMPVWKRLVEPIAESVVAAMGKALPAEAQAMAGPMIGLLNQIGGAMFSQQIGQAVGGLSQEVISATDIGFPVTEDNRPAIVLTNASEFASGLGVDESDVLLYLVLRECAHQRLFLHAPWLRDYIIAAIEDYGRGITIDTSKIEESMRGLDPSNMDAVQDALNGGLFDLEHTPAQQAALTRLETTLALVEGWVDEVVGQAAEKAMPQAQALREAVRRRRASGGPAEETFAALVGLELRPRRLRDASALFGALRAAEGAAARDAVWAHPDSLPGAADLDDPLAFAERTKAADSIDVLSDEFDAALAAFLQERPAGDPPSTTDASDATGGDTAGGSAESSESDSSEDPDRSDSSDESDGSDGSDGSR